MKTSPIKTATLLLSLLLSIFGMEPAWGDETEANDVYRIGVSHSTIGNLNPNDASAALKAWAVALSKEYELDLHIEINLNTYSTSDLKELYALNKLDGLWLTVSEMLDLGITPDAIFSGDRANNGPEVRYAIIVHEQGEITSLSDLVNGNVLMTTGDEKMALAVPWLEMLINRRESGKETAKYKSPISVDKPSNAIFQVFFQQSDAAIVTKETFELACELNPQLRKKLKVLSESPPFITSIFIFRPSLYGDPKMVEVEKALLNIHKTVGGDQLLSILKSNRMGKYPSAIMDGTIQFLKAYERVMKHPVIIN